MLSIAANPTALTLRWHKIWCLSVCLPLAALDRRETDLTKYFIDSNPILPRDFWSMDNPQEKRYVGRIFIGTVKIYLYLAWPLELLIKRFSS